MSWISILRDVFDIWRSHFPESRTSITARLNRRISSSEAFAFVVVREGKVVRTYSNKTRFPFITAVRDIVVLSKGHQVGVPSHVDTRSQISGSKNGARPRRRRASASGPVFSQRLPSDQPWCEPVDGPECDEGGERTAKER
jgi:hypothetical protein